MLGAEHMHIFPCVIITVVTMTVQLGLTSSEPPNAPGYLGCFGDRNRPFSPRALRPIGPVDSNNQSVEWCFRHCWDTLSSNYRYAGLEYAKECFCGNNEDYDRYEEETDCQDVCTGNSDQICGDSNRISIYIISQGVCSNDIGPPTDGSHSITNPRSLSYNLNNFKFFGTRVNFYCGDGYTLNGASSIECIDTGYNNVTWNDTVPVCEGAIVGIAVGITAVVGILGLLTLIVFYRRRRPTRNHPSDVQMETIGSSYVVSQPSVYSQVIQPKKSPEGYYVNYNVDVTNKTANEESATGQLSNGVIVSSSNGDETEWAENELYGKQPLSGEIKSVATSDREYEGKTDEAINSTTNGQCGWIENIIYE